VQAVTHLLDELVELERRVFSGDRLTRRGFARFLRSPTARVILARQGGELVGYTIVTWAPPFARLYSIGVLRRARGKGLGCILLLIAEETAIKQSCEKMRLEVRPRNHIAIKCYRKLGYEQFGRIRCFYEDGSDALRFEKMLWKSCHLGLTRTTTILTAS
jgi:ribosomal protein S18 acetylase RimI-like enzyme